MYFYILAVEFFIFSLFYPGGGTFFYPICRVDTRELSDELAGHTGSPGGAGSPTRTPHFHHPPPATLSWCWKLALGWVCVQCTAYCLFPFSVTNGDGGRDGERERWKRAQPKMWCVAARLYYMYSNKSIRPGYMAIYVMAVAPLLPAYPFALLNDDKHYKHV
jgi:hypothetical protein